MFELTASALLTPMFSDIVPQLRRRPVDTELLGIDSLLMYTRVLGPCIQALYFWSPDGFSMGLRKGQLCQNLFRACMAHRALISGVTGVSVRKRTGLRANVHPLPT